MLKKGLLMEKGAIFIDYNIRSAFTIDAYPNLSISSFVSFIKKK